MVVRKSEMRDMCRLHEDSWTIVRIWALILSKREFEQRNDSCFTRIILDPGLLYGSREEEKRTS